MTSRQSSTTGRRASLFLLLRRGGDLWRHLPRAPIQERRSGTAPVATASSRWSSLGTACVRGQSPRAARAATRRRPTSTTRRSGTARGISGTCTFIRHSSRDTSSVCIIPAHATITGRKLGQPDRGHLRYSRGAASDEEGHDLQAVIRDAWPASSSGHVALSWSRR